MRALSAAALVLVAAMVPSPLPAMNLPVYDLVSKVYLSTDIVLARISMDEAKHKIATVQETLLGTLPIGSRLDQIDGYLTFFAKTGSDAELILFLDSRPRKLDFLYKEFEKAPYAIVPSGVELIDQFGHVHSYYQPSNPGGYFPAGYQWFHPDEPLTENGARDFPTLTEEKQNILEAIHSVEPVRVLLSHPSNADDVPQLLHFMDTTSGDLNDCAIRTASAIREDAIKHIKDRNDPDLLLRAEALASQAGTLVTAMDFLEPAQYVNRPEEAIKAFRAQRAEFLLNALADKNRPVELRRTALDFLLLNSAWGHPYSGVAKVLPIDAPALAAISSRINVVSRSIFSDPEDDAVLRGMCLRFLDLGEPVNVALVKKVYKATNSDALRFEIEDVLLRKSEKLFMELAPPSSAAGSIVGVQPKPGCAPANWSEPTFFALYRRTGYQDEAHRPETDAEESTVFIDRRTGKVFVVEVVDHGGGVGSDGTGWGQFAVAKLEGIPAGQYSIEMQFRRNGAAIGHGYGVKVRVIEEPGQKKMALDRGASQERPQLSDF
jgi:hypothetical protein